MPSVHWHRAAAAVQKVRPNKERAMKAEDAKIDGRGVVSGDDGDFDLDGGSIIGRPIQNETPAKKAWYGSKSSSTSTAR